MSKIAVDMMGSDLGPSELIKGVFDYKKKHPNDSFILFGDKEILEKLLDKNQEGFEIRDFKDVIDMEIDPITFLRHKESSLYQAILAVKNKEADAVISAGSTGGLVIGSTVLLKNIEGISRAGLCSPFPTLDYNSPATILDIGASITNTYEDLIGFALMGRIYAKEIFKIKDPSVYLLSNGTEEGKGSKEACDAYKVLKEKNYTWFKGNTEARNALDGKHDVVVTNGYSGNVFLKATEGMAKNMSSLIKKAFKKNFLTKIGYLLSKKGFDELTHTMDYKRFGGAIFLGVNGVAVKAHGNSDEYGFYSALEVCHNMIEADIINKIKEQLNDEQK